MKKALDKIRVGVHSSCDFLELLMAVIVLGAILVAGFSLGNAFLTFWATRFAEDSFLTFIGYVFNILIGIEFLKMLCQPSADTVLEVLMFLVARHMILEHTTVLENFVTIVSIALLFAIKKYINLPYKKGSWNVFNRTDNQKNSNTEE